jgi:penicillin G amidase
MTRLKKVVFAVIGVVLIVVLGGAGAIYLKLHSSMATYSGTFAVGTSQEVTILRDERGVAYIKASTLEDLCFAQGYIHAQERLWQMELHRRVVQGRLSEIFGADSLEADRFLRTLGLHRITRRVVEKTSSKGRIVMQSYARGVNAFLEQAKPTTPEMLLLRFKVEPWSEADVAGTLSLMAYNLGTNWSEESLRMLLKETLSSELYAEILPPFVDWKSPAIWTKEQSASNINSEALLEMLDIASLNEIVGALPRLGSNSWVLSPNLYEGGSALLANDPHLNIGLPNNWYEICLELDGEMKVYGWSIPGAPGVIIGHNDRVAWGMTNIGDTQDLFVEERHPDDPYRFKYEDEWYTARVIEEEIKVKGQDKPELMEIIITRNGPLILTSPALSLRWTAYEIEASTIDAIISLNDAHDWEDFRQALFHFTLPVQNIVYADIDGNIGFRTAGLVPMRKQGLGLEPSPGWSADYGWKGFIPMEELPELFNPPQGYIATANHRVVDDRYPYPIMIDDASPYRMMRILDVLGSGSTFTLEEMKALQNDWYNSHAATRLPLWVELLTDHESGFDETEKEGFNLLKDWLANPVSSPYESAPAIYAKWYLNLIEDVFKTEMEKNLYQRFISSGYFVNNALDYLLEKEESAWFNGSPDQILLKSYRRAIGELSELLGTDPGQWQWRNLQKVSFDHVLGKRALLKLLFNRGPYPYGGDNETVGRARYFLPEPFNVKVADSLRFIMVMEPQIDSHGVIAGGQSGHFMSKHYDDQINAWLEGRYYQLINSQKELLGKKFSKMILKP